MSKTWYPVINNEICTECGLCIGNCMHGVYDEQKAPRPVVVFPDGCVEGCTGCGDLCPSHAIGYFGDRQEAALCGCGGCCGDGGGCCGDSGGDCGCGNDCDCGKDRQGR
ncbi:MAG: 4Fe-4S ferredoxin [Eubacteriales bacterium]|nr:4Fe-4S ferredoxin [Eubacteriales bacterium]